MAAPVVAGIDVGGTKILGVAYRLGERPEPLAEERVATPSGDEAILEAILAVIDTVTAERPVDGVGVGAPGLVDRDGILHVGPNLRDIAAVPVRARLAQNLDVPVTVENDATCATWAEHEYGAASVDDALVVTLGTGIGAGIVSGGALQRGTNGFAGEAGHMVVDPSGPPCPCGRRGCWERYALGAGLGRLGRDAAQAGRADRVVELAGGDPEDVRGEHVGAAAAAEGDPDAVAVLQEFAYWVALGLANLVNLLDPEVVVVGGGLVAVADLFLPEVRRAFDELVFAAEQRPALRIEAARVGEEAGALGAALLAAERQRGSASRAR